MEIVSETLIDSDGSLSHFGHGGFLHRFFFNKIYFYTLLQLRSDGLAVETSDRRLHFLEVEVNRENSETVAGSVFRARYTLDLSTC